MELNKLRLSQIDTSDIETSDFASQTQVNTVQSNLDSYASYANTTFSGGGTATGNGVVFSTSFITDASNTYSLIVTSNGAGDYDIVSGSDRASVLTGSQDPNVYIEEGDVISITNNASGHPLYIKYNSSIGTGDTVPGVTNQGADGGTTLTWDTSVGDAGTYFYQCSNHLAMNGYLIVQSAGTYTSDQYYTTSNVFTLPQSVDYRENLLVYLNGLLQHPDAYTVSSTDLTLANTDPLPINMKIAVRELAVAGGLANVSLANVAEARASNAANGTLTFDYEGSNLYIYDGTVAGGYYLPLTQAVTSTPSGPSVSTGYVSGGYTTGPGTIESGIQSFPFASDVNSSNPASQQLTQTRYMQSSHSSDSYGYSAGGTGPSNVIDKFPFSSTSPATDVGDLLGTATNYVMGGTEDTTHGYVSGGWPSTSDVIQRFPFSSDSNATDVGELSAGKYSAAGVSSSTHGYVLGGGPSSGDVIDKFAFAASTSASDIGELNTNGRYGSGDQNSEYGYRTDHFPGTSTLQKLPFASDTPSTAITPTAAAAGYSAGVSGSTDGYALGSATNPYPPQNMFKHPYASDTGNVAFGSLLSALQRAGGHQG